MKKWIVVAALLFSGIIRSLCTQDMPPAQVVVSHVFEKEIAQTSPFVGIVDFNKIADVAPEIEGLIENHFFDESDLVTKGDPLVKLGIDFTNKDIEIIQKQIEEIDVKIQSAGKNVGRLEKLFKTSASSEREYDEYFYLHKELLKQKERLGKELERLNLSIEKSTVRAPFTGIVLEKFQELGEWVNSDSPICSIASTEDIFIKVAALENLRKFLFAGQKLVVEIKAIDEQFDGEILSFVPVADMKSKTFFVKVKIPYFDHAIRNMSATVHVPVSVKKKMSMIRRDALIKFGGKDFIYTIDGNKAQIIPIDILVYDGEYVGVDSPQITTGMPVVIDGNDRLQPDQAVIVKGD